MTNLDVMKDPESFIAAYEKAKGIPYLRVSKEVRRELLYSLSYRHVNQETLALVFDIILYNTRNP